MSAIVGIFFRDGKTVDPELIKRMNGILSHRGPDGSKTWSKGQIAFGHQMLYTTPESLHEELPFYDEETGLAITADARIDNREELSQLLELDNIEKISDSQFILKAYEKWGESCPEKLLGDFVFAIWDSDKKQLFCARDHMGIKPFYYYLDDNIFVFGTEIKSLWGVPEVPYKLNQLMAAFHFIPIAQENVLTLYEKILRLPAGHSLQFNQSNFVLKKYWVLDPNLEIQMDSDEDYVNMFHDIFNESVRCRLRSAFPIGYELSGGLDSSSIVTVAKNINPKGCINTFSLITNFHEGDEQFYIQKLINSGSIKPHFLFVDDISPLNDMDKIIWHADNPIGSANVSLFWNLYKIMQNNNIRILLNGIDGDSVLSHGQNYLKELTFKFQFKRLIEELYGISKIQNVNPLSVFFSKVVVPIVPQTIRNILHKTKVREGNFIIYNEELDRKLNIKEKYEYFDALFDSSYKQFRTAKELHYFLIVQSAHQKVLELIDSLSSAFSIENRYPFFDKRLIEFCYGIPTEQKFKYGWDRSILRRAMTGYLPEEIQRRTQKKHLTSVTELNLLKYEKKYLDDIIDNKTDILRTFLDPTDIQKIYERYKTRSSDYQRSDAWDIWNVVTFTMWLEKNKNLMS